jgi:hypothetical protein
MNCRLILTACSLSLTLALVVVAGQAAQSSPDDSLESVAYQPVPSPTRIDASVSVEATHELAPQVRSYWTAHGHNDQAIDSYRQAVAGALTADIANSGLFARIVPANDSAHPDYILRIQSEIVRQAGYRLRITIIVSNGATGAEICLHRREALLAKGRSPDLSAAAAMPGLMAELKAAVAADIQPKVRAKAELAEVAGIRNAGLSDLLVASDSTESIARERNRALVAAKNLELPAILREKKTDELSALVVKIEQTILDLDHECEVAKDQAQQSIANTGNPPDSSGIVRPRGQAAVPTQPQNLDELRGLAICYRERIELLKPIAAALKEEIVNRNR